MSGSTEKSVVMGVAAGYSAFQIAPFITSLKRTGYRGRIVLFVDPLSQEVADLASENNVIVFDLASCYHTSRVCKLLGFSLKWLKRTRGCRRAYTYAAQAAMWCTRIGRPTSLWKSLEREIEGYQSLRYLHYRDALQRELADADWVLISDVRDVLFQDDPFRASKPVLEVFLEAETELIGASSYNKRWLSNLYSADIAQSLSNKVVSCSGVTRGSHTEVVRYLNAMCEQIESACRALGAHDQGIHNYLLYTGMLDPVLATKNESGDVLTAGVLPKLQLDSHGRCIRENGVIVPIVHQYDRHPEFAMDVWEKLRTDGVQANHPDATARHE